MPPWWALASGLPGSVYPRAWALVDWAVELVSTELVGHTGRLVGLAAALYVIKRAAILAALRFVPLPPAKGVVPALHLADADSRYVEVNGLAVHHTVHGQGAPAVVLLHGFAASSESWRELVPALSREHAVVAYDRPGFGLTERPEPEAVDGPNPYGREAQVPLLMGLMDAMGIERAVLVGHSAGGGVALAAALAHPERVSGLVLVDAAIYREGGAPPWLLPLLGTTLVRRMGQRLLRGLVAKLGERIAARAWHDPSKLTPELRAAYERPFQVEGWDRALWHVVAATKPQRLAERLGELAVPTLVVTGDHDRVIRPADSRRLARELPGARLVVIEAAGHVPHEEQPGAVLAAVRGFLAEVGEG